MSPVRLYLVLLFIIASLYCEAQADSVLQSLQQVPLRYIKDVDKKIDKYQHRITNKTIKTLEHLSKWENKIKPILQKVNPEATTRLFGDDQLTFSSALEKYKKGEAIVVEQRIKYDEYKDKLSTSLGYLAQQKDGLDNKIINSANKAKLKIDKLQEQEANTEAIEQFIKERRKQLIDQSIQYIGNSKYLQKISKENYYYFETLKNYKELFHDKKKAEETTLIILNKIPAFKKFVQQNGMLSQLFGASSVSGAAVNLAGLQTRLSVNALIQNQIASGGPNASEQIIHNLEAAKAQLSILKDKILKSGGSSSNNDVPDFKPRQTKTQTIEQRLEKGFNVQFAKNNNLLPTTADIGLHIGYKMNDKSIIGIGVSYKVGIGSIQQISISHQGLGLRSYTDWRLKKQFYLTGGYEVNYNAQFKRMEQLRNYSGWQTAGLLGLSKKIDIKTKLAKGTKFSLFYDIFAKKHRPISQPVLFRIGYDFK
jgi:hypothetical protein